MIYEVQARVVRRVGDPMFGEATVSCELPTFLIDGDIQGIVHDAGAAQRVEQVARKIVNPAEDPSLVVHVIVAPRDLPRTNKDAHEVVIPNLGTLSLPALNLDGALELAVAFACADELTWVEDEEGFCADHGPLVFVVDTPTDGDLNGPCVWDVGLLNYEGSGSMMGSAASVEAAKTAALAAGRKYLADAIKRLILTGSFDGELVAPEPVPAPKAGFLSKLVETLTRK